MKKWIKKSETLEKIGYRWLTRKIFKLPNGYEGEFTILGKQGDKTTAIIALTNDKKVIVATQFRPGPEIIMHELPGGLVDRNESAQEAAARELLEETGYVTDTAVEYLGHAYRGAYATNRSEYYFAVDCYIGSEPKPEESEDIEINLISIDELIQNAKSGEMTDTPAVIMAYDKLMQIKKEGVR